MKVITFAAIKGGVGKTSTTALFGEWLAKHKKKILYIDLDSQCNLSHRYDVYAKDDTVGNAFIKKGKVDIKTVKKNIDLISGDPALDNKIKLIVNEPDQNWRLFDWFTANAELINQKNYDFVLIDTPPAFSIPVKNAILISEAIVSPIIPSKDSYDSYTDLGERLDAYKKMEIDHKSQKTYVTAKLYILGNMLKPNTTSSNSLKQTLTDEKNYIGYIPYREFINKLAFIQKSIFDVQDSKAYSSNSFQKFYKHIDQIFTNMEESL